MIKNGVRWPNQGNTKDQPPWSLREDNVPKVIHQGGAWTGLERTSPNHLVAVLFNIISTFSDSPTPKLSLHATVTCLPGRSMPASALLKRGFPGSLLRWGPEATLARHFYSIEETPTVQADGGRTPFSDPFASTTFDWSSRLSAQRLMCSWMCGGFSPHCVTFARSILQVHGLSFFAAHDARSRAHGRLRA